MLENKLVHLLRPIVEEMGYELWGCIYHQGKHALLRVYIDSPNGIGIEDCQQVSRAISAALDVEDPIPGHYSLEISSPGIPRPLFYVWQFQRYIGHPIQIKLFQPYEGKRNYMGTVHSVDENELILIIDGLQKQFPVSNIVKANLTVE